MEWVLEGRIVNGTTAPIGLSRTLVPHVYGLNAVGDKVKFVTVGEFNVTAIPGQPKPEEFSLQPGQSMAFTSHDLAYDWDEPIATWWPDTKLFTLYFPNAQIIACPVGRS